MRATRSGIVIGLALALLVPGSVVGQEASPSAEPSAEPSPSVEAVMSPSPSPDEAQASPSPRPPLRDIKVLLNSKQPKSDFTAVKNDFSEYLAANPEVTAAVALTYADLSADLADPMPVLNACKKGLKKAQSMSACASGFGYLVAAYAFTRADEAYDLLGRYVGSTKPSYRKSPHLLGWLARHGRELGADASRVVR